MTFYYRYLLDVNRDYLFSGSVPANITSYVKSIQWQFGVSAPYDVIGAAAYMQVELDNSSGDFMLEKTTAKYYGKLRVGTLVKAQMSTNGSTWTQMCLLKIQQIIPSFAEDGKHGVTLKCSDITQTFLNQEFVAPLQTNVRIDEILDALHAKAIALWPYESYYQFIGHTSIGDGRSPFDGSVWTNFETAETTLPYYGDNLDRGQGVKVQQYIKEAVEAEAFGLYYFSPRSERFIFLSRYHASDTAISWYVTNSIMQTPKFTYARDLKNDYSLSYYPRAVGTANSILYQSDNVPFVIAARDTKRLTLRYRDPNNESASVGALVVDDMVLGVDIIANTASDGSGLDKSSLLDITLIKGAASSDLVISNRKRGDASYITTLQLKGTPITAYNKEVVFGYNDDSVFGTGSDQSTGNDRATSSDNFYAISDEEFAQDYANYQANVFSEPQEVLEKLVIVVKDTDTTTQAQVLARTIGDVINVTDSITSHNTDYMIVGEMHQPNATNGLHTVTYTLRPTNRGAVFVLDESTYDSGDVFSF